MSDVQVDSQTSDIYASNSFQLFGVFMNSDYVVVQVRDLAKHAEAGQQFAWRFGNALDALWKAKENVRQHTSIEVSFKETQPGAFDIYRRIKGAGEDGFDDLVRLASGDVTRSLITFNASLTIPEMLVQFFKTNHWETESKPLQIEVR